MVGESKNVYQILNFELTGHPPEISVEHQYINILPMFSMLIDGPFPYTPVGWGRALYEFDSRRKWCPIELNCGTVFLQFVKRGQYVSMEMREKLEEKRFGPRKTIRQPPKHESPHLNRVAQGNVQVIPISIVVERINFDLNVVEFFLKKKDNVIFSNPSN